MATKKVTKVQAVSDSRETFVSILKSFTDSGDVQEKLQSLFNLQQIDSELDKIYKLRGELPAEVEALQDKISDLSGKAASILESITECEKKVAEFNQQYKISKDQAAKYQAQIDAGIENSREYDSLSKEIENQELLALVAEKRIREIKESIEQKQQERETLSEKIALRKEDLAAKKEELDTIAVSTAKQEEKLLARRKESAANIDARTMSAYERIRKSVKNHIAVASIYNGNCCGGCFNEIAPQKIIDIFAGKKMIICEYCGRILVAPEESKEA